MGAKITVTVSWTDLGGTAESLTSDATAVVTNANDAPAGSVTITGTATQGEELTADTSAITDDDGVGTFSYQWKRDGTAISDATTSTYTLVQADVGAQITVTVSWTDLGGTAESLTSDATAAVTNANDAPGRFGDDHGHRHAGRGTDRKHERGDRCRRAGNVLLPVEADRRHQHHGHQRRDRIDLHAGAGGRGRGDHGDGQLD